MGGNKSSESLLFGGCPGACSGPSPEFWRRFGAHRASFGRLRLDYRAYDRLGILGVLFMHPVIWVVIIAMARGVAQAQTSSLQEQEICAKQAEITFQHYFVDNPR
jgi:hypothetical protein